MKTFALQGCKPADYRSTADANKLRTLFVAYVPSDTVQDLQQQVRAKQSRFYVSTTGIPQQLAAHVDPSYAITTAADPISDGDSRGSSGNTAATSDNSARLDAIIGVCSALGGIALCILVWMVIRNVKRNRMMAHRRLSDPPTAGMTPAPGQQFDRDSIGGQRRRSFYYAEDSLRGFGDYAVDETYHHHSDIPPTMRERRPPIEPGAISAPILRDNTLNW